MHMHLALRTAVARAEPTGRHWYYDADPEDRREYDAFGPWIGEVDSERDLPRLYRPFWPRLAGARFVLKIPIDVERVRVRPGTDLYKAVLAVDDAGVLFLRMAGDGVVVEERGWDDIAAIQSYSNLLIGRWSLFDRAGGRLDVDYNTVSARLMDAITEWVRARTAWDKANDNAPRPNAGLAGPEPLFRYILFQLGRAGPRPVTPIHVEAAGRWCRGAGRLRRLTTARMVAATPAELILVDRGEPSRAFWATTYASSVTTIPWDCLTGFAFQEASPARLRPFHALTLDLAVARIRFPCLDTPDAVIAALVARGVPERSA
jgi:hypothetical protein